MDPLGILKEFCSNGQLEQVEIEADRVKFSDKYSFPKHVPTAFKSKDGTGDFYSLEAVTFFIKSIVANPNNMGAYVSATVRTKTQQIDFRDREPLRDYLTGKIQHTVHLADVVPTVNFYEPAPKKQKVEETSQGEAAALRHLLEQEKQLRDRNSLLCAPGANFKPVLDMLDKVLAARKAAEAAASSAKAAAAAAAGKQQQRPAAAGQQRPAGQQKPSAPAFMKPSGRMERTVGLNALGADAKTAAGLGQLGYGIQVDAAAAAAGSGAAAAAAGGGSAAPRPASAGQQHRSSSKGGSAAAAAAAGHKAAAAHHKAGGGSSSGLSKHKEPPIILVPSGVTAMINIFNAKQFLQEGRFVRSDEAAAAVGNVKPSKAVDFNRTALRNGPRFPRYQITDKVPRAGHPDWKRVVAVIVQGKAWQFKDFPFKGADKGELMETFSKLFGAYFYYSDEQVPDTVNGWSVVKLPMRRHARHLDHTAMLDFYTKLDAFLQNRRCELDY